MLYASFSKIPEGLPVEAITDLVKRIQKPKHPKGVKLFFKDIMFGRDGDDFRHNRVTIRKTYDAYRAPRIAIKKERRKNRISVKKLLRFL